MHMSLRSPFCLSATASAAGFLIRGDGDAVITREHGVGGASGNTACADSGPESSHLLGLLTCMNSFTAAEKGLVRVWPLRRLVSSC